MTMTVIIPEPLTSELRLRAKQLHIPANELVVKLVRDGLHDRTLWQSDEAIKDDFVSIEQVVAQIKAQPKDFQSFHPASQSIDEVLARLAELPVEELEYSPSEWDEMWVKFERELKASDRADDIVEGRL